MLPRSVYLTHGGPADSASSWHSSVAHRSRSRRLAAPAQLGERDKVLGQGARLGAQLSMEGGFLPEPAASPLGSWPPQAPAGVQASASQQQQQQQRGQAHPPPRAATVAGPLDAAHLEEQPEALGGCSRCPSLSFNSEWHRAFGVVLCNQCRRQEGLISKVGARLLVAGRLGWWGGGGQLEAPPVGQPACPPASLPER